VVLKLFWFTPAIDCLIPVHPIVKVGDFPKFFPGGPKVVKFVFYPSKLKKQHFLLIISKSSGSQAPPSDAHGYITLENMQWADDSWLDSSLLGWEKHILNYNHHSFYIMKWTYSRHKPYFLNLVLKTMKLVCSDRFHLHIYIYFHRNIVFFYVFHRHPASINWDIKAY